MTVEEMTENEAAANRAAGNTLVQGKYYNFNPPVTAIGIPVGGPGVCNPQELQFSRGWYLGFRDERHVFQGPPIDDPRPIDDNLRECYFHILFVGGVSCTLDSDQNP